MTIVSHSDVLDNGLNEVKNNANAMHLTTGEPTDRAGVLAASIANVAMASGDFTLNEGIALLQSLLIGGAGTAYNNANSRLGVGDSSAAENAAHTGLQAATNKVWVGMESGYPSISGQKTTWRAIFDGDTGNFSWQEFTVVNAADDAGDNLNRKVSDQGTKALGQIWTLDLEINWS